MNELQDDTQLWMVPYADLMSMLVILFMALFGYAYSMRSAELEHSLAKMQLELKTPDARAASRLKDADMVLALRGKMGTLGLSDLGLEVTDRRIRLTLPAPVLFAEGSAELERKAAPALDAVADLIARTPYPVLVEGHTDNVPIASGRYRTNWELSAARAFSVIERCIARGLPAERFSARGYAEYRPVAPNDTPEGRRANRRIEISLLRAETKETGAPR